MAESADPIAEGTKQAETHAEAAVAIAEVQSGAAVEIAREETKQTEIQAEAIKESSEAAERAELARLEAVDDERFRTCEAKIAKLEADLTAMGALLTQANLTASEPKVEPKPEPKVEPPPEPEPEKKKEEPKKDEKPEPKRRAHNWI